MGYLLTTTRRREKVIVGLVAGFLLQGTSGALVGVVFAFIGSAILTVSFSRDAALKNEEL